jgi:hypothetical protein
MELRFDLWQEEGLALFKVRNGKRRDGRLQNGVELERRGEIWYEIPEYHIKLIRNHSLNTYHQLAELLHPLHDIP